MDRNPAGPKRPKHQMQVALRKESVDRNCYLDNIEITQAKSLSARRAWIEIQRGQRENQTTQSVALRKESVDRNTNFYPASLCDLSSLSARRAWIEIMDDLEPSRTRKVALRKESVDRNRVAKYRRIPPQCRSPQGERG